MELNELRSFVKLAELMHFGRAASALNISQPALSKQIKKIESEVGASLFHRGTGGTLLSATGAVFVADARELLAHADKILDRVRSAGRGEIGALNVGFGIYTYELVPRTIARFRRTHPHIDISLRDLCTATQIDLLRNNKLDIGFTRETISCEFLSRSIGRDHLVLAVPKAFFGELRGNILENLKQIPFVQLDRQRSASFYERVMSLCRYYEFIPKIEQEATEFSTVLALVASGAGVAMVPRTAAREVDGIVYREIGHPIGEWGLSVVWRKSEQNPIIENFMKCLDAELTLI